MDNHFMQESRSKRMAYFVVANDSLSGQELQARIGLKGDRVVTAGDEFTIGNSTLIRRRDTSAWEISSVAAEDDSLRVSSSMYVDFHLEWLLDRILPIQDRLQMLHESGSSFILRIVQYMAADESQGHGIAISQEWVRFLSALNGKIDIDQYVE